MASFILLSLTPTFFQAELLSGVELKSVGIFSASVGRPSPSMLRTEWVSVWGYSQGAPVLPAWLWGQQLPSALLTSTASIHEGNGWGAAPWNTNLECYKKKKIRKYSRRLRRIEVLNCSLSTSHILIINLCVNTWDFFLIFELDTQRFSVYLNTFRIFKMYTDHNTQTTKTSHLDISMTRGRKCCETL